MSENIRLTTRLADGGVKIEDDNEWVILYPQNAPFYSVKAKALLKLAELEDKIENGQLIDIVNIPRLEMLKRVRYTRKEATYYERAINRLQELENMRESGQLVELPCKVGDTVYGVDFTECQDKYVTTEKEKRKIFNTCTTMNGRCDKCKYSIPAIHKFVCTQIQLAEENYNYVVGAKCENYRFENVFLAKEAAEARLKELQEGKK